MRNAFAGSIIGLAVSALPLAAAADAGQWYLNPAVGFQTFDSGNDDRDLDDEITGILGLEYQVSDRWGVELRYMQSSLDNRYNVPSRDADLYQGSLDLLRYLGDGEGWEPYLAIGVGHADFDFDSADNSGVTQANAGGGVRYLFDQKWSVRGDLRYLSSLDTEHSDGLASLGVSYAFGAGKKKPEPKPEPAPAPVVMDADGDGVADGSDRCPNTPAGVAVNASGCPLDKDGDGVPNYRDKCPDTPAGRQVDQFGCKFVLKRTEQMKLEVNFASNSSAIPAAYASEIEKVAAFLKKFGGVSAVIEGHTDSSGSAAYNKQLSQKRADSVKAELVTKYGIDASRLTAIGYGEDRPVAENNTNAGRKANRRVVAVMKAEIEE